MSQILKIDLQQIFSIIGDSFKQKIIKHLFDDSLLDPEDEFYEYIKQTVYEIIDTKDNKPESDYGTMKESFIRKRNMSKKNWFKTLETETKKKNSPIYVEYDAILKAIENNPNKEQLLSLMNLSSIDEFVNHRLSEIEKWATNPSELLCNYQYLETMQKYQIKKAIRNDVSCLVLDYLVSKPGESIHHFPSEFAEFPLFNEKGIQISGQTRINPETKIAEVYDERPLSNGGSIIAILPFEENEKVTIEKITMLDDRDLKIVEKILAAGRGERFIREKIVTVNLIDLIEAAYESNNKASYEATRKRLSKIARFYIEGKTIHADGKKEDTFVFNFFQYLRTKQDDHGNHYVEIVFSDLIHSRYINDQTIKIYSHLIHKLDNPISKVFIYSFHKERVDAHIENRPLRVQFDYEYFTDRYRFRSKKKSINFNLIESSLKEFMMNGIMVSSYERNPKGFEIRLIPLTESEAEDYFRQISNADKILSNALSSS